MEHQQEQRFTIDEVTQALESLDVDARHTVLEALQHQVEQKKQAISEKLFTYSVFRFAAVFERATAENASDSNIEGWQEELLLESEILLEQFGVRGVQTETDQIVRDTASITYLYLNLERFDNPWDAELVVRAGSDLDDLLVRFQNSVIAAAVEGGEDEAHATSIVCQQLTSLDEFRYSEIPDYWEHLVRPIATDMRLKLIESGYELPELDEDGKYGYDDEVELP